MTQVILKPDPGNAQELYLGSLEALGIDTKAHDIRFVEDNWESPVLGAWGLGWEVWLDGMEVGVARSMSSRSAAGFGWVHAYTCLPLCVPGQRCTAGGVDREVCVYVRLWRVVCASHR